VNVGATKPLTLGTRAIKAGVGLAADTRALIIGQCGVQCSTGVKCNQHAPTADNGIASKIITSAEATSLNRHVMFLKVYYGVGARMGCDPDHSRL
jgi:hypothetical protein